MVQPNNPIAPAAGEALSRDFKFYTLETTLDITGSSDTAKERLYFVVETISQFAQPVILGETKNKGSVDRNYLTGGSTTVHYMSFAVEHPDVIEISYLGPALHGQHGFSNDGTHDTSSPSNNVALVVGDTLSDHHDI